MTPSAFDITRTRGDTLGFGLYLRAAGAAYDLDDCSVVLQVTVRRWDDDEEADPLDFELTGTIGNPTSGIAAFSLTEDQANLPAASYYFRVILTTALAEQVTVAAGRWVVRD